MKRETIHCDACEKQVKGYGDFSGFCIEIGYSTSDDIRDTNGWGYRRNLMDRSIEVCDNCFKKLMDKSEEFEKFFNSIVK